MEIELFHTPKTRSHRPRWLLEELGVEYRLRPVDLFGGEKNPLHPLGSVPAITLDGTVMIESCAICHWLADRYPEAGLAPSQDAPERIPYEQWMFFVPGTLEPPAFDIVLHTFILPENRRVAEVLPFAGLRYRAALKVLNETLEGHDFIVGDRFSAADILLGSTLQWLPEMLEDFSVLQGYVERLTARPACQRAMAEPA